MPRLWSRAIVAGLCMVACAAAATVSWRPGASGVRTEDHNRDGQPDVWREYDGLGQLADVLVDTNFDGRSDVHEYYDGGALVRRESDRDFNDRVDLVQEFDASTRERARSVVDTDFDGTADLLVLFQGGRPVFSKWARRAAPALARGSLPLERHERTPPPHAAGQMARLEDPFRADSAVRAGPRESMFWASVWLSEFNGLTVAPHAVAAAPAPSSALSHDTTPQPVSLVVHPYSPRGPPAAHLLS